MHAKLKNKLVVFLLALLLAATFGTVGGLASEGTKLAFAGGGGAYADKAPTLDQLASIGYRIDVGGMKLFNRSDAPDPDKSDCPIIIDYPTTVSIPWLESKTFNVLRHKVSDGTDASCAILSLITAVTVVERREDSQEYGYSEFIVSNGYEGTAKGKMTFATPQSVSSLRIDSEFRIYYPFRDHNNGAAVPYYLSKDGFTTDATFAQQVGYSATDIQDALKQSLKFDVQKGIVSWNLQVAEGVYTQSPSNPPTALEFFPKQDIMDGKFPTAFPGYHTSNFVLRQEQTIKLQDILDADGKNCTARLFWRVIGWDKYEKEKPLSIIVRAVREGGVVGSIEVEVGSFGDKDNWVTDAGNAHRITRELSHLTAGTEDYCGEKYNTILTASAGMVLPAAVTVKLGSTALSADRVNYNQSTGALSLTGLTGTEVLSITAAAELAEIQEASVNSYSGTYDGGDHVLTATATHTPIAGETWSYQWYKGTTVIPNATAKTYSVKNVADSGEYQCEITYSANGLTTSKKVSSTVTIAKKELTVSVDKFNNGLGTFTANDRYENYIGLKPNVTGITLNYKDRVASETGKTATAAASYDSSGKLVITVSGFPDTENYNVHYTTYTSSINRENYVKIGDHPYNTLQAAVNAATAEATLTVVGTVADDVTIGKNLKIDGGGTLTGKVSVTDGVLNLGESLSVDGTIELGSNGTIDVTDYAATGLKLDVSAKTLPTGASSPIVIASGVSAESVGTKFNFTFGDPTGVGTRFAYVDGSGNVCLGGYDNLTVTPTESNKVTVKIPYLCGMQGDSVTVTIAGEEYDIPVNDAGGIEKTIELPAAGSFSDGSIQVTLKRAGIDGAVTAEYAGAVSAIRFEKETGVLTGTPGMTYLAADDAYKPLPEGYFPNDVKAVDGKYKFKDDNGTYEIALGERGEKPTNPGTIDEITGKPDGAEGDESKYIYVKITADGTCEYNVLDNNGKIAGVWKTASKGETIAFGALDRDAGPFKVVARLKYDPATGTPPGEWNKIGEVTELPTFDEVQAKNAFLEWYEANKDAFLQNGGAGLTETGLAKAREWVVDPGAKLPESVRGFVNAERNATLDAIFEQYRAEKIEDLNQYLTDGSSEKIKTLVENALTAIDAVLYDKETTMAANEAKIDEIVEKYEKQLKEQKIKDDGESAIDEVLTDADKADEKITAVVGTAKDAIQNLAKGETETDTEFQARIDEIVTKAKNEIEVEKYKNVEQKTLKDKLTDESSEEFKKMIDDAIDAIDRVTVADPKDADAVTAAKESIDGIAEQAEKDTDTQQTKDDGKSAIDGFGEPEGGKDEAITGIIDKVKTAIQELVKDENETDAEFQGRVDGIIDEGKKEIEAERFIDKNDVLTKGNDNLTSGDLSDLDKSKEDYDKLTDDEKARIDERFKPYESLNEVVEDKKKAIEFREKREEIIGEIEETKHAHDGELVTDKIHDWVETVEDLKYGDGRKTSEEMQAKLDALTEKKAAALEEIKLVQKEQQVVNQLEQELNDRKNSGKYSEKAKGELQDIFEYAKVDILDETTGEGWKDRLDGKLGETMTEYDGVDVIKVVTGEGTNVDTDKDDYEDDYDFDNDGFHGSVENDQGMSGSIELVIKKEQNADGKNKTIANAEKNGNIIVSAGSAMTEEQAKAALTDKDLKLTLDAYLLLNGNRVENFDGSYTVRILLPKELRGTNGLQIVYLGDDGKVEVFDTTVDGNYIIFQTTHFSEFLIIGEKTVNLLWAAIALAVLLLAELIVIFLLHGKNKKKKGGDVKLACSALPLLAAALAPTGIVPAMIALGGFCAAAGAVIVVQLVKGRKTEEPAVEECNPVEKSAVEEISASETNAVEMLPALENAEENEDRTVLIGKTGDKIFVTYDYSFEARLTQSVENRQRWVHELKEYLLSYGLKETRNWKARRFYLKRKTYVKMLFRGKTLNMFLALDPAQLDNTRYRFEDVSAVKKYAEIPVRVRIRTELGCNRSKELIDEMMRAADFEKTDRVGESLQLLPFKTREELIDAGLVKMKATSESGAEVPAEVVAAAEVAEVQEKAFVEQAPVEVSPLPRYEKITAQEVADISDEVAAALVYAENEYSSGRTKGIVNIDRISEHYQSGEVVTVANLKEKKLIPPKVDFVKVLARGTLDKALTVKAQEFSGDAIKMIVLVGGTAVKIKVKE